MSTAIRTFRIRLAVIGLAWVAPAMAWADTDYRCLSDCLHAGALSAQRCLAQCTYQPLTQAPPPLTPEQAQIAPQSRYSQFQAPVPTDELLLPPSTDQSTSPWLSTPKSSLSPTTQPLGPSTNYKCVRDCLGNGYQHDLCVESCSY